MELGSLEGYDEYMGLIDDEKYHLDKKEVLSAMELIADAGNQNEELSKQVRSLIDLVDDSWASQNVIELLKDIKMNIDICSIYIKESKAKMIKITKDQLPF